MTTGIQFVRTPRLDSDADASGRSTTQSEHENGSGAGVQERSTLETASPQPLRRAGDSGEEAIDLRERTEEGNPISRGEDEHELTLAARRRQALLALLAATACTFTGCGLNFAFGVFQELYEVVGGPFEGVSAGKIDLIGTLAVSLMTLGAPWASAWTALYGPGKVTACGSVLFAAGMLCASWASELWQFYLTQGVLVGIGTCLSYIPAVTCCPGWYDKRRGLAMGIVLSGTGIGGLVWAPVTRTLISRYGFRNALRILGCVGLVLLGCAANVLRWSPEALRARQASGRGTRSAFLPVDWRVAKGRLFMAKSIAAILQAAAYYMPIYFISSYARRLGMNASTGAGLIGLSNGLSAGGKIALGWVADRYGRINTLAVCTLLSAVAVLALWAPGSVAQSAAAERGLFISFVILYGVTAGVYVSLFPTVLVELFGVAHFASINGFLYMLRGIGTLTGTPLTGMLIRGGRKAMGDPDGFLRAILTTGILLTAATAAVGWVRWEIVRRDGCRWKA